MKAFEFEMTEGKVSQIQLNTGQKMPLLHGAYNIVDGYSDTVFGPNDNITREQMAIMVVRAAGLTAEGQHLFSLIVLNLGLGKRCGGHCRKC